MMRLKPCFLWLIMLLVLCSCAAKKQQAASRHIPPPQPQAHPRGSVNYHPPTPLSNQRDIIVQHAIQNLGRSYKWGGQSPQTGFDCSGLIVYTHQKADIKIPRTAKAQFGKGKLVSTQHLQAADLVFFETPAKSKVFHVGIYIGDGMFVHAPGKGRQVTYGYLDNPYFKRHYIGSRTYL